MTEKHKIIKQISSKIYLHKPKMATRVDPQFHQLNKTIIV